MTIVNGMADDGYVKVKKFQSRPEKKWARQERLNNYAALRKRKDNLKFKRWACYPVINEITKEKLRHHVFWREAGICVKKEFVTSDHNGNLYKRDFYGICVEADFLEDPNKFTELIFHVCANF
jgi:hypothetical protein